MTKTGRSLAYNRLQRARRQLRLAEVERARAIDQAAAAGFTTRQIAKALGTSQSTVTRRIQRRVTSPTKERSACT